MDTYAIRTQAIRSFSSERKLDENDISGNGNRNSGRLEVERSDSFRNIYISSRSFSLDDIDDSITSSVTESCKSQKSLDGLTDQFQEDCGTNNNNSELDEIFEVRNSGRRRLQRSSVSFRNIIDDSITRTTTEPCESQKPLDGLIDQFQEDCGTNNNNSEFDEISEVRNSGRRRSSVTFRNIIDASITRTTTEPCESENSLDGLIDQFQEDCGTNNNNSEFDEISEVIEDALEGTRRLRNAKWEDLEPIRTAFQKFQSMLQDRGVEFLQDFLDLGGVYRLLLYLRRNEDNSECISFVGRILSTCLRESQTREPNNAFGKSINWSATGRNSFVRSEDCEKIAHETVTMIVKREGIESFLRANDNCVENLNAKDAHQQTAENVWTLYGIWGFIFRVVHESTTVSTISRGTLLCLFDSALSTLEIVGKIIDRIDEQDLLDRSYLAYGTMSYVFKTLRQIVKHSSIDTKESFSKTHRWILKKCAGILESNYRSGHLQGRYRRKIWIDAVYFFLAFFKKFQLKTSKKRFQWFWHDDILTFFVRVLRNFPDGDDNLAIFKILHWISSAGFVTKFSLLQKHGVLTAISTVLESKEAGAKSKKLARHLLKSLCE